MNRCVLAVAMFASLVLVSACGGGGTDAPPSRPPSAAQGLWTGLTTSGRTLTGLVFGDGTYYIFYSPVNVPAGVAGVVQGSSGTATAAAIWSSTDGVDFNLETPSVQSATVSAGFVAKQSFSGTITFASGAKPTFTTAYDITYEVAPTLTALAGSYTGQVGLSTGAAGVQTAAVVVAASGAVTGTTSTTTSACSLSGTATPRTNGNAYDVALVFSGASCTVSTQRFAGIAYFNAATKKLYVAAPNADRTDGVLFLGTKP